MKNKIKLIFEDGNIIGVERGTKVSEVLNLVNENNQVIALRVNGVAVDSNYEISDDSYIQYITMNDRIGKKIYIEGIKYIYILAVKEIYGDETNVSIKHSLDKSIYSEIDTKKEVNTESVKEIKKRMQKIIDADLPFKLINVSRRDALEYFKEIGEYEKVLNYKFMTNESVSLYELGDMYNYFYYLMPTSTKVLSRFNLTYVAPKGIAISYPINNVIPKYTPSPLVLDAFKNYQDKLAKIGVKYAADINKIVVDGKISDYIRINEIIYDQNIEMVAQKVCNNKSIKSIFISGPSSSGKTTSSKKLALQLRSKGKDVFVISTDDYFLERKDTPKKADGSYEFESVDALDIKLFNNHLKALLSGKEVIMPTFNFVTGEKEFKSKPVKLEKNQILIVEGLHAINEKLSMSIDKKNKLKVYISPFTPIGLDRHNHISTTDVRLLRRLVRDYMHRGYSAEATMNNWLGMRKSESDFVYPYQRLADVVLNTSLSYEIGVLRTYAEPLLYSVEPTSACYEEAIRILNFLKGFMNIPGDFVPQTSVLREFIGNSYFE